MKDNTRKRIVNKSKDVKNGGRLAVQEKENMEQNEKEKAKVMVNVKCTNDPRESLWNWLGNTPPAAS